MKKKNVPPPSAEDETITTTMFNTAKVLIQNSDFVMSEEFYFPPSNPRYANWLTNFSTTLTGLSEELSISADVLRAVQADQAALAFSELMVVQFKELQASFISTRNVFVSGSPDHKVLQTVSWPDIPKFGTPPPSVEPEMEVRHKNLVMTLRNHPKMTPDMAKSLGILTKPKSKVDPATYRPELTVTINPQGRAILKTPMHNFKAYRIFRKLPNQLDPVKIYDSITTTFIDTIEGEAGLRDYYIQMLDNNAELVGLPSLKVTVMAS